MTIRAAVTVAPRQMEVRDTADPVPAAGQALLRMEAVGICGSDLHVFHGTHPYATFPQTQGHELSGTVVAYGDGGDGPVPVGERVAVEPLIPCGHCYPCRRGRQNCCTRLAVLGAHVPGGMQELFVVRTQSLYPVGDLEPDLAALVEPVSIGLQVVVRAGIEAGETVAVFGAGAIGQAVLLGAVDRGARVAVVDLIASRLELASGFGAEVVVRGDDDPVAALTEWTGGDGPAVVIDATGVPAVIRSAFDLVAASGRIVIVGISTREVSLPVIEFTRKELTVLGSRNNAGVFGDAVDLVRRNRERIGRLITHRFPLEDAPQAIEFAAAHPDLAEKVIIEMGPHQ